MSFIDPATGLTLLSCVGKTVTDFLASVPTCLFQDKEYGLFVQDHLCYYQDWRRLTWSFYEQWNRVLLPSQNCLNSFIPDIAITEEWMRESVIAEVFLVICFLHHDRIPLHSIV